MRRTGWVLGAVCLLAVVGEAGQGEFHLRSAKLRLPDAREGRETSHSVTLSAQFLPGDLTRTVDPSFHEIRVTIGGVTVFDLPAAPREGLVYGGHGRWSYREPGVPSKLASRLSLNLSLGKLKLKVKRLDLTPLLNAGPRDVEAVLEMNGQVLDSTVTFTTGGTRNWRMKNKRLRVPPGGIGTIPTHDGPTESSSGAVNPVALDAGLVSSVGQPWTTHAHDAARLQFVWSQHRPGATAPFVDFTKESIVAIFLGTRPTTGFTAVVESAARDGAGLGVNWLEGRPGADCLVGQAVTSPYLILRVPRFEGFPQFVGRVETYSCDRVE